MYLLSSVMLLHAVCLICGPANNMARAMAGKMTMFFGRGALQVVVVAAEPRSSLNSKAQSTLMYV